MGVTELVSSFGAPLSLNETFWKFIIVERSYQFERLDVQWWKLFMERNWTLPFYGSAIYILIIFGLERYMKHRAGPGFNLKTPLICWNIALLVFSIAGLSRVAPVIFSKGVYAGICVQDGLDTVVAFWAVMFAISKFVELGDTLFIVLRKRPLQLLQYYHHVVTLIVVWITTPIAEPVLTYFMFMNYAVHSAMYPYFALRMAGISVPKKLANLITTAQLLQMILGFILNCITIGLKVTGYGCHRTALSIWAFVAVYGSFIVLFGKLFRNSVIGTGEKKQIKTE